MFSGIVAAVGRIRESKPAAGGRRLVIETGRLSLKDIALGDSIAVDGVCLTVVAKGARAFEADVSRETLACTAGFEAGGRVNLEKALRLADRLGGHLVSGHVDGVGAVTGIRRSGSSRVFTFRAPAGIAKYLARKGSVTVQGVSLTINRVQGRSFSVNLIPHTLGATTLGGLRLRDRVNLEADMMARYAERLKSR